MSLLERSFDPWEEMQRHGLDLADRLTQGFNGLLQSHNIPPPPPFPWPPPPSMHPQKLDPFLSSAATAADGVSAILNIGGRLGQAGAELGACFNGAVQQFFRQLPVPFRHEDGEAAPAASIVSQKQQQQLKLDMNGRDTGDGAVERRRCGVEEHGLEAEHLGGRGLLEPGLVAGSGLDGMEDEDEDEEGYNIDKRAAGQFGKQQGSVNMTSTYDSRTNDIESSLVARGDLWRVEASHSGSTSRNETSPLFLVQLGPVLFLRDTTLLLPVHLSKQHLLWYGYERKNGMRSLCPAIWSKHRRWLLMSMICLNPFACGWVSFKLFCPNSGDNIELDHIDYYLLHGLVQKTIWGNTHLNIYFKR